MAEAQKAREGGGQRFIELDGLRGVATALVVCAHINFSPFFWAWMLMDMFFVMSSFLLGRIALKKVWTRRDIVAFYRRRIERIWPLYFIVVWVVFLATLALNSIEPQYDIRAFWRYFTFSHYSEFNFAAESSFTLIPHLHHLWSIAIEEQFYILLPWFIFLLRRLPPPAWLAVLALVAAVGITQRAEHSNMLVLSNHLDAFVLGGVLAAAVPLMGANLRLTNLLTGGMIVVGLAVFLPYTVQGYVDYLAGRGAPGFSPWPATAAIILWGGVIGHFAAHGGARHLAAIRWAPFVYLGRLSYALYLVHYPIFRLLPKGLAWLSGATGLPAPGKPVTAVLALGLSLGIAHLLYELVDRQLQSKGDAPPEPARQAP